MTKIKICGLRRLEDVHMVNRFQPDACGFILSRPFRRYVPEDQLKLMKAELDPGITAFGVFVNEPYETVCRYLQNGLIDAVQLHL